MNETLQQQADRVERIVEDRRAGYRAATDQLADGTRIGRFTKQTIAGYVLWVHRNGKRATADILVEEGQKAVDQAIAQSQLR